LNLLRINVDAGRLSQLFVCRLARDDHCAVCLYENDRDVRSSLAVTPILNSKAAGSDGGLLKCMLRFQSGVVQRGMKMKYGSCVTT
jgi:hypothetical protein